MGWRPAGAGSRCRVDGRAPTGTPSSVAPRTSSGRLRSRYARSQYAASSPSGTTRSFRPLPITWTVSRSKSTSRRRNVTTSVDRRPPSTRARRVPGSAAPVDRRPQASRAIDPPRRPVAHLAAAALGGPAMLARARARAQAFLPETIDRSELASEGARGKPAGLAPSPVPAKVGCVGREDTSIHAVERDTLRSQPVAELRQVATVAATRRLGEARAVEELLDRSLHVHPSPFVVRQRLPLLPRGGKDWWGRSARFSPTGPPHRYWVGARSAPRGLGLVRAVSRPRHDWPTERNRPDRGRRGRACSARRSSHPAGLGSLTRPKKRGARIHPGTLVTTKPVLPRDVRGLAGPWRGIARRLVTPRGRARPAAGGERAEHARPLRGRETRPPPSRSCSVRRSSRVAPCISATLPGTTFLRRGRSIPTPYVPSSPRVSARRSSTGALSCRWRLSVSPAAARGGYPFPAGGR